MINKPQKEKYSLPEDIVYLNTAYSAPLSKEAEEIGINALKEKSKPYNNTGNDFFEPVEKLKSLFANLIDAPDPQNIAIIPSVSYGISIVANNIHLDEGDEIIVMGEQFPSNIYAWKRVADKYKGVIKTIDAPDETSNRGQLWNKKILDAITDKTAIVAIPNIHWTDGTIFNLQAIREKATANNALLIIDGTQSIGAFDFSINEIKPDALICAGYKWLMGPYALGVAYFGEYFNNGIPLEENWINRKNSEDFAGLVNYEDDYKEGAYRYNMGEMSNFNLVPMLTKTIAQLIEWTPNSIQKYCENISKEAIEELRIMNCFIEDDNYRAKHLFGIKLADNMDIEKLQDEFNSNKVFVSIRGEYIRVSPHVFNTKEDFQTLVNCFRLCISF